MSGARDEAVGRFLQLAERSISLLRRVSPKNFRDECEALVVACQKGTLRPPRFEYGAVPPLPHELVSALKALVSAEDVENPWRRWHRARARELLLEANMAEALGTPAFARLARERFGVGEPALSAAALALAEEWVAARMPAERQNEPEHTSDDLQDKDSLGSLMLAEIGQRKLPFRMVFSRELASLAAVGEQVVAVRAGAMLTRSVAERVVVHEIVGHALPRQRAQESGIPLLTFGSAGGFEDQEGRALWLEATHGFLDAERRQELGARHLAVNELRKGADWVEIVRHLGEKGLSARRRVEVACRVFRGGGWGREEVYLPAYLRVTKLITTNPRLHAWMGQGRLSAQVAEELAALGFLGAS
ncbi:MAG: DUF1704 domain-containing protein [Polyangiaceae bacterium]|nr:DUF1704 domain-containing protein [Polyangiaceae bacterium]